MSGRTENGVPPRTGEAKSSSAAHQPARFRAPSSRASRYAATAVPARLKIAKHRPATSAAVTGSDPCRRDRPGGQCGQSVVERRVNQNQRVAAAERSVELPRSRSQLPRHRKQQGRLQLARRPRARVPLRTRNRPRAPRPSPSTP